jgi:hypothetical protein
MPHRAIRNLCSNRVNSLAALQCTLKSLRLGGFLLADHRRFPRLLRDHYRVSLVGSSGQMSQVNLLAKPYSQTGLK